MTKFKYGNHDEVLEFGKKCLSEYINKLTYISPYGDVTVRRNIEDGLSIISRLGDKSDRLTAKNIVETAINHAETSNDDERVKEQINCVKEIFEYYGRLEKDNGY